MSVTDKTKTNLRVLALNVFYGKLEAELTSYIRDKIDNVSVFCLQEVDDPTHRMIDSVLGEEFISYHYVKYFKDEAFHVSLYIKRDIEVVDIATIFAPGELAGFALRSKLILPSGEKVAVTSAYGTPRPGHKLDTDERLALSKKIIETAGDFGSTDIIAGDFNLLPQAESVKMFAENGFRDLIKEYNIHTTRNELTWQEYPPDMWQMHADYTFVRGEGVVTDFVVEDVRISDHLPMVVDVEI